MKPNHTPKYALFTGIMLLSLLFACSGDEGPAGPPGPPGPTGPASTSPVTGAPSSLIYGIVEAPSPWYEFARAEVRVQHGEGISNVYINGHKLSKSYNPLRTSYINNELPFDYGDVLNLQVLLPNSAGAFDTAVSAANIPGQFTITSHDTSQFANIDPGNSVTMSWSAAQHATSYRVSFYGDLNYYDISNEYKYSGVNIDTIIQATSLNVPASTIWPSDLGHSYNYYGTSNVRAINGPAMFGDLSNIQGDAGGLFVSISYGGEVRFSFRQGSLTTVSTPPVKPEKPRLSTQDMLDSIIESFEK